MWTRTAFVTGDLEKVNQALQRTRTSMSHLHHLTELPEFDGREDDTLRHMRVQEFVSFLQIDTLSFVAKNGWCTQPCRGKLWGLLHTGKQKEGIPAETGPHLEHPRWARPSMSGPFRMRMIWALVFLYQRGWAGSSSWGSASLSQSMIPGSQLCKSEKQLARNWQGASKKTTLPGKPVAASAWCSTRSAKH